MKKIAVFSLFMFIYLLSFSENEVFRDITRDHWAYKYVENLVYKGIIPRDTANFNGDENLSRYEMAEYLSKVLNKLDDEKASQEDLRILEKLVYEFSKELNNAGMNIDQYVTKLKKIEDEREKTEKRQNDLEERIKRLESGITTKGSLSKVKTEEEEKTLSSFENIELLLKSKVYSVGNDFSDKKFSKQYEAGIKVKQNNGELSLKYDTVQEKAYIEGEYNKILIGDVTLHVNTPGYNRDIYSYFENILYRSLCENWETSFEHEFGKLILAKEKNIDSVTMIINGGYKYFDIMALYNTEEKDFNYEAALMYEFFNSIKTAAGLAKESDYRYINIQAGYKNKEIFKMNAGYERKDNAKQGIQLYNLAQAKANFKIIDNLKGAAKVEFFDTTPGTFLNYGLLLKDKLFGLDLYISFDKKKIEKYDMGSIESISLYKENNIDISIIRLKGLYKIGDNIEISGGYAKSDFGDENLWLISAGSDVYIQKDIKVFFGYKKSNAVYYDIVRDIEGEFFDIDNNNKTFVIGESSSGYNKGRVEAGFELKF